MLIKSQASKKKYNKIEPPLRKKDFKSNYQKKKTNLSTKSLSVDRKLRDKESVRVLS